MTSLEWTVLRVCVYMRVGTCVSLKSVSVCVMSPLHCPLQVNNKANTVTSPKDSGPAPALVYTHNLTYTRTFIRKTSTSPHLTPRCGGGTGSPFHRGSDQLLFDPCWFLNLVYKNIKNILWVITQGETDF